MPCCAVLRRAVLRRAMLQCTACACTRHASSVSTHFASRPLAGPLTPLPQIGLVPYVDTVHNRLTVEIRRGCTRGCRFCQPGMLTRPARDVEPSRVVDAVEHGMRLTVGAGLGWGRRRWLGRLRVAAGAGRGRWRLPACARTCWLSYLLQAFPPPTRPP